LPPHDLSRDIITYLQQNNIDTSAIILSGERIGLYFLNVGSDMKSVATIYDRSGSSFATLSTGILDWEFILQDVSWFHFSAIASALSSSAAALCKEALEEVSKRNITISVDLNYRSLLWKYGMKPVDVMSGLIPYCNVIMGNIWSANILAGTQLDPDLLESATFEDYLLQAKATATELFAKNPCCNYVANTFRFHQDDQSVTYYGVLNTRTEQVFSPIYSTPTIIDKVGSGDCFMAGLIYGITNQHKLFDIISFAAAAAFGKLQEKGDITKNNIADIQRIVDQYI
jgi:2-dehydro-3-deoxygluconokinase